MWRCMMPQLESQDDDSAGQPGSRTAGQPDGQPRDSNSSDSQPAGDACGQCQSVHRVCARISFQDKPLAKHMLHITRILSIIIAEKMPSDLQQWHSGQNLANNLESYPKFI